jgi:electron transport complex protein RnfC
MLATQIKPDDELLSLLPRKVFCLYCIGCKEVYFPLGEARALTARLREKGFEVTGEQMADYVCRPAYTQQRLEAYGEEVSSAEAVLVFSCGVGVQVAAELSGKPTFTACDTMNLPGYTGLRPTELDCERCADCVIGLTGGICPVANCAKSLVNGPCGGAKEGKCEIDTGKECIWLVICDRLAKQGRLGDLKKVKPLRDYSKGDRRLKSNALSAAEAGNEE